MNKSINLIIEAANKGGYKVKYLEASEDTINVNLEKDYIFFTCTFDLKQNNHYLSKMDDKFMRTKGVTYEK